MLAWLALICAVLAFGTASLLQAHGARMSDTATGLGFFAALARSPQYAAGTVLDLVAVLLTAYALRDLPLFLVQAATSSSLAVTAIGAALLFPAQRRPGSWRPVVIVTAGLTLLGFSAAGGASESLGTQGLLTLTAGIPLLLLAAVASDRFRPASKVHRAVLAGLAYAGMGISMRSLHVPHNVALTLLQPAAISSAAYLVLALAFFGRALQRGSVTEVMAVVVSIDTLLPAGVGIWLLGDHTRPGWGPAAVAGLALTFSGVLWLIRSTSDDEPATVTAVPAAAHIAAY